MLSESLTAGQLQGLANHVGALSARHVSVSIEVLSLASDDILRRCLAKEKKQARVHTQTAPAVLRSSKRPRTAPMDPVQCALHEVLMALCRDPALVLEAIQMNLEGDAAVRFCEDKDYRTEQRASHSAAKRAALGLRLPDV